MRRVFAFLLFAPVLVAADLAFLPAANAAAQRTFVASYGSPANTAFNCSLTKPCRAFSDAMGVTNPKGEVVVLDSAGYGPVTISQSVSIISPPGVYAGISVFTGDGVTVAGTAIDVLLRGLTINGQGGTNGIVYGGSDGSLSVDGCNIAAMANFGIYAFATNGTLRVKDSTIVRSGSVNIDLDGTVTGTLNRVYLGGSLSALSAADGAKVTVTDSALVDASTGGVIALGATDVMVSRTAISGSDFAFYVHAFSGEITRVVADGNSINNISDTVFYFSGGSGSSTIYSPGNNTVGFNNGYVTGGALTTPCCLQ